MKKNVALSSFLIISLKFLFLLILVESIVHRNLYYEFSITSLVLSIIAISLVIFVYFYLKKNYSKKLLFIILLSVGLIFRVLWFLNLDSIPIGDFNRMFICAGEFLDGSNYMFRGTSYFARFPHMTATVLYFAIIRNFFSNPLIAIRIINIVLSMFNIILIYMISKEIFKDEKKSFWVLLISALYPPMILYSNVYCSENLAMPLLLLSVLMFFKSINNKQNLLYLCLSGIFLSLSHLFRPNGYVFIIAYIMYLFLYFKENITVKLKNIADKYIDGWFTNKQNERQTLYEMSMLGATNFKVDYFMPCAKFRGTKKIAGKIVDVTGKKCISLSYTYKGKTIETGECRPFKTAPQQGQ